MNTYIATFTGRQLGAVGIFHPCKVEVQGKDEQSASLALYDTHEHITGLVLTPKLMGAFLKAYLTCSLWSSVGDDGEPLDRNYSLSDFSHEALTKAQADCKAFQLGNAGTMALAELSGEQVGHNLWLNRNGHGSGFWDEYSQTTCEAYEAEQAIAIGSRDFSKRDALNQSCICPYHACQRLSDASKSTGSVDLYVGDDGQLHFS